VCDYYPTMPRDLHLNPAPVSRNDFDSPLPGNREVSWYKLPSSN
jgi:hypothetical protein